MKVATSYFYQIRFFQQNMLPVSTAVWDPKWFHSFQGQDYVFYDKRGIVNGVRCEVMAPHNQDCRGPDNCPVVIPDCSFKRKYRAQLDRINCGRLLQILEGLCESLLPTHDQEPIAVFIVHEAPNNPCSERAIIQEYFKKNGVECNELVYPIKR